MSLFSDMHALWRRILYCPLSIVFPVDSDWLGSPEHSAQQLASLTSSQDFSLFVDGQEYIVGRDLGLRLLSMSYLVAWDLQSVRQYRSVQ